MMSKIRSITLIITVFVLLLPVLVQADLTSGLVAYYTFNGTVNDESGNGNHGTIYGNIEYVDGKKGQAIFLNNPIGYTSITQYVTIPYSQSISDLESSSFTIAILYKSTDTVQQNGRLFGNGGPFYPNTGICMDYNAIAHPQAYSSVSDGIYRYSVAEYSDSNPDAITTDGQFHWQTLILDRDNKLIKQYIDNNLIETTPINSLSSIRFDGLVLGATEIGDTYGSRLTTVDEVRIYNRALTETEIQALYSGEFIIVDSGAEWRYSDKEQPGWTEISFDNSQWNIGITPFDDHSVTGWCAFGGNGTNWPLNTSLYLRKDIDVKQQGDLTVRIAIDNDFVLYFDGNEVAALNSEWCPYKWQYEYNIPSVNADTHTVAVKITDRGDDNGFDLMVSQGEGQVWDSDGDGLPDSWEISHFGDLIQNPGDDYDHDELTNLQEYQHGTDPTKWDTDGDGVNDGTEVAQGTDPLDPASSINSSNLYPKDERISMATSSINNTGRIYLSWNLDYPVGDDLFSRIKWKQGDGQYQYLGGDGNKLFTHDVIIEVLLPVPPLPFFTYSYSFKIVTVYRGQEFEGKELSVLFTCNQYVCLGKSLPVRHSPILFVPGTGGKAWGDMNSHLEDFGLVFGGELNANANNTISDGDFYTCNYPDPTGPIANNYGYTKKFIDKIQSVTNGKKITLVGQSLGGLRARAYIQKKERDNHDEKVTNKIERLITIGSPNLGVLNFMESIRDIDGDGQYDIYGIWRNIMGNTSEKESDFWSWSIACQYLPLVGTNYKFEGGFITDPSRFHRDNGSKITCGDQEKIRTLLEDCLRDGTLPKCSGGWDFTGAALMYDVFEGSPFMKGLNCWLYDSCDISKFTSIPEGVEYRYVVGIGKNKNFIPIIPIMKTRWLNYFLYKNEDGDGFIEARSQSFQDLALHPGNMGAKIIRREETHYTELSDYIGLLKALDVPVLKIAARCPVEITVESPSGLIQSKSHAEILGARYDEADINNDGRIDKFIEIPLPEQGEYKITLTPETGANPNDTYSLEIEQDGIVTVLRENEPIGNITGTPETVSINARPIADAGPDQVVQANCNRLALVTLDGFASTDSGSTPGTNDDIEKFQWFEGTTLIAEGEMAKVSLIVGEHEIRLLVTDHGGAISEDRLFANVLENTSDTDGDGITDCNDNCDNAANTDQLDSDGDGVGNVCDNCPNTYNPDQRDSNSNGIGDACDFKKISSYLGNDPKPSILDIDIFKFRGTKGETVTIRIEANPPPGSGKRLTLILTDKIKGTVLVKLDRSVLPNDITAKLLATGEYLITVAEQPLIAKGERYRGSYCLTLKARPETYQTLAPYLWVE